MDQVAEIGRRARARVGAEDVRLLKWQKTSSYLAEGIGRLGLQFAVGPWGWWLGGVGCLAYHLSVEAQLNHSIMHGAYVGLPGAKGYTPEAYETLAIPFQSATWRDAHRIHHANPSLLEKDPDTVHPLFRIHAERPWRVVNAFNSFIGAFFTFEFWAFDYDRFLKREGLRPRTDRAELLKFSRYALYQFVLFPLLAGPRWRQVLVGALAAVTIRNLVFTALQTASSVGESVSTRHPRSYSRKSGDEWVRFQVETSKNFKLRGVWKIICGGLDRHIEHHLYSGLPPNRFHELSPELSALCARHGVKYTEYRSIGASLADSLAHLAALARRPVVCRREESP